MRYLINVTLRYKSQISFFLTLFISIILYTNNSTTQVLYIRTQFSDIARWILQPVSHLQYLVSVEEENALLRASEIQLRLQLESMHYLQRENERLHALLGFRDENPLNLIPAKIISKGIKSSVQSAIIDVGTQDGVRDNSGVLSTRGVVGKVISAGERSAIVELLNDVNFRLAVRVLPEGATGIMRYVDENRCEIHEIPKNAVIAVGDRVVTSGFSDIYPAGLPVGIVSGIFEERGSFQKVVTVDIYDKLNTIMHVFVISDNE